MQVKLIPFAFSIAVFILLLLVRITPQGTPLPRNIPRSYIDDV